MNEITTQSNEFKICTVSATTKEEKAKVFKALVNPTHKISDFINKKIKIKDIVADRITTVNENGDEEELTSLIFLDDKGESYQCCSKGMITATRRLIDIFGTPTYDEPIEIIVKQVTVKRGSLLTFEVV